MANLDTRNKRGSAIGYSLPSLGHIWPDPDGALAQADRQQVGFLYPGIAASSVVTPSAFDDLTHVFSLYVPSLIASHSGGDASTFIQGAQPSVRAATHSDDDLNTAYAEYLTPLF